ncbi:MAG: DJ-1/PfpI family protein, partial [Bdellovibrionota bacterium]
MLGFVITYPECIIDEVEPTIALLAGKISLQRVNLDLLPPKGMADFLIIPGGSCDQAVVHSGLHELIQDVLTRDGFVAGICNGAVVLASAGVLKNRRCTHTAHPKYAPLPDFKELLDFAEVVFKDSIYIDEDVVV